MATSYENSPSPPEVRYLDELPALPSSQPEGHPHILDVSSDNCFENNPRVKFPDGVATMLFNYNPEALDAFLDLARVPGFKFTGQMEESPTLVISREGRDVMVRIEPRNSSGPDLSAMHAKC